MIEFNSDSITIICQEFDKSSSEPPDIYIVKHDVSERDLFSIRLRSIYNPELRYYATRLKGSDEEIVAFATANNFCEPYFMLIK